MTIQTLSRKLRQHPFWMLILGVLGISLSAIFVRLSDAPSAVTASSRLVWTVALMTPFVWGKSTHRRALLTLKPKHLLLCLISGVFLAIHFALWFESLKQTSVASSTAIVCTEVIWVALGYALFLNGKITWKAALCIGAALGGSFLIAFSDSAGGSRHLYGDLLSLLAAIAVAVYTLLGRAARKTLTNTVYTYLVYVACAVTLLLFTALSGCTLQAVTLRCVGAGFFLALFSTILGHSIFSWCLRYISPAFISASKLCEPIVAACFAAILLGEIPGYGQLIGGLIVICGVFFYSALERRAN